MTRGEEARGPSRSTAQFFALVRKNFTLKTRGILCCCTGVEIILPVFFLAVLCLPKALVKDSVNNDVVTKPYQIATPWGSTEYSGGRGAYCVDGYKLLVAPATPEATRIANKAAMNLICSGPRSSYVDSWAGNFLKAIGCETWGGMDTPSEPMVHHDPALAALIWNGTGSSRLADVNDQEYQIYHGRANNSTTTMRELCRDSCLRDTNGCYKDTWGDHVLPHLVKTFATKADGLAWIEANPGPTLAFVAFAAGVEGSEDASAKKVRYSLHTNTTAYDGGECQNSDSGNCAYRTREYTVNEWEAESDNPSWRGYGVFSRVQNAIDAALIDEKDGDGVDYGVTLDASVRPFPWLGYDYNIGGIIAAGVFSILGALAFMSNVVIIMKSVVVEKELRLREGMQMMGMSSNMYWLSWFYTHFLTAMCTVVLIVIIGMYPFEYTNPFLQLVFYTLWITSCILWNYMISTVFSRSITASVVGCFVYVMSIAPAIAVRIVSPQGSAGWLATCLLPGSSINMWGHILARLELAKEGITFETADKHMNKYGDFSAASVIGMVFLDCVLYALMTWYLDKVWPTEFGQKLSPLFPFTKEYWLGESHNVDDDSATGKETTEFGENFEPLTDDQLRKASVKIRGLKKQFSNGVVAVDDLTVTFVPGQVSALLGHNGAGKTTTISMLTGTLNATGGDAVINGKSIRTEMGRIRESLGICPQFDVLWPTLTVREHLRLYAAFGGMDKGAIPAEIVSAVNEVALSEKLHYKTGQLSGGQKRKLSLAISFIGKPSVVFLDEPTSGMDPYSRRFTWEVIRKRAATSSIMLTTHFLDEADLLCDRIAIMSAGKLACVGSPVFLKNRYGAGYHLTLARKSASASQGKISAGNADGVLALVRKYVGDNATLASDVGAELSFTLPFESTAKFPDLFKDLDGKLDSLGFQSYGISCTTLEEVFLSIARGGVGGNSEATRKSLDAARPATDVNGNESKLLMDDPDDEDLDEAGHQIRAGYVTGWPLVARQCKGLLWKRRLNWQRDWKSILVQLAFPVLFFVLALVLAGLEYEDSKDFQNMEVTRRMLGNRPTIASVKATDAEAAAVFAQWPEGTAVTRAYQPMMDCACNCPAKGQNAVFDTAACCMQNLTAAIAGAAAAGLSADATLGYCAQASLSGFGSAQGSCGLTSGGVGAAGGMDVSPQCASGGGDTFDAYLWSVTEERVTCDRQDTIGCDALHVEGYDAATGRYQHTVYAHQSAYHSVPATVNEANSAILRKRTGGAYVGISVSNEWLPEVKRFVDGDVVDSSNDTTFITSLFIVMGASILTASVVVFPVYERRNNSKHLQMVSGINKVAYWCCHWLADAAQMIVPIAAIMIIFAAFNIEQYRGQLDAIFVLTLCFVLCSITYTHLVGFYFKNEFYAFVGLTGAKLFLSVICTATGMVLELLKDVNDDTKKAYAALSVILPIIIPHYSYGKGLYDIGQNKLNENRQRFNAQTMSLTPMGSKDWWAEDVIGDDIAWLVGLAVGFGVLIILVELSEGSIATLASKGLEFLRIRSRNTSADNSSLDEADDEDVAEERRRVNDAAAAGFSADRRGENSADTRDGVILHGITKTFGFGSGAKKAVRNLSVGMPRGQCFGLLGINGAGKTSTFKMITGEFAPTRGDTRVLVTGGGKREYLSVHEDLSRARTVMGYCPQFDGLQPNLTGREHLQFYAQVRGVPDELIEHTVNALLEKMSLTKYSERQAGTYSGGNKRKLSVAIALIGEPAVVLLDEPSTGMDPEARRFMWDVISASTRGRTIVLTSHSMEECEALCNRIGIMVGGQFKCLGSLQHLKNRFSEGYTVDVRFQSGLARIVYDAVVAKGIHAQVMESHDTELKLRVDDTGNTKLWQIFAAIEDIRAMKKPERHVVQVDGEDPIPVGADDAGGLIDDYSVSQTTLEQVFVRFASTQSEETQHAPGMTPGIDGLGQPPLGSSLAVQPPPPQGEFHQFAPADADDERAPPPDMVPPGYVQRP